jgi:hypothetical protein
MVGEIIDILLSIGVIALAIGQIGLWILIRKKR